MIAYQDFAPQPLPASGFLKAIKGKAYETFDAAVAAANEWIESAAVDVVNVETVVLPNIWSEEGTTDVELSTASGWASWYQFVRVWYSRS